MAKALVWRQRRLDRRWPFRKVADYVEQAKIAIARGDEQEVRAGFKNLVARGDALLLLALSAEANGLSPAKAKKVMKASRFFRRCASEVAILLWGDVETVKAVDE
jgi:hypothetical protein